MSKQSIPVDLKSMSPIQKNKRLVVELEAVMKGRSPKDFPALDYLLQRARDRLKEKVL